MGRKSFGNQKSFHKPWTLTINLMPATAVIAKPLNPFVNHVVLFISGEKTGHKFLKRNEPMTEMLCAEEDRTDSTPLGNEEIAEKFARRRERIQRGPGLPTENEFFNITSLSLYLNIKASTLYTKVQIGELPHYRIGRLIRFKKADIDRWLEEKRKDPVDPRTKARLLLKSVYKPRISIDKLIRKSIDEVKAGGV